MKKTVSIILVLVMVFALCACGASKTESKGGLKTVQDGKLVMATNASFPPYEFISDEDGATIVGIDAEIAKAIADKLGLELVIEDMDFSAVLTAVQSGKADVCLAGLTVTEERKQNVDFSTSYAKGVQSVIVTEDSAIKSIDDLTGKKIGVQESTTGHIYCEDEFGSDNVTAYANGATAVEALKQGKVDCVVIDNNPAKAYVAANKGLKILDTAYAEEDYAIATNKGNPELTKAIDEALTALIADGSIQKILDKYISA